MPTSLTCERNSQYPSRNGKVSHISDFTKRFQQFIGVGRLLGIDEVQVSPSGNKFIVSESVGFVLLGFACVAWFVFVRDFFVPLVFVVISIGIYLWSASRE
jgi:hypothetical protein